MRNYKLLVPLFVGLVATYASAKQVQKPKSIPYKLEKVMHEKDLSVDQIVKIIKTKLGSLRKKEIMKNGSKAENTVVCMAFIYISR